MPRVTIGCEFTTGTIGDAPSTEGGRCPPGRRVLRARVGAPVGGNAQGAAPVGPGGPEDTPGPAGRCVALGPEDGPGQAGLDELGGEGAGPTDVGVAPLVGLADLARIGGPAAGGALEPGTAGRATGLVSRAPVPRTERRDEESRSIDA